MAAIRVILGGARRGGKRDVTQNFLSFTEVDPSSHITVTANSILHDSYRTEFACVYKDFGEDHFTDFTHYVDVICDLREADASGIVWMLANEVASFNTIYKESKTGVALILYPPYFGLYELYEGSNYDRTWFSAETEVWYYLKIIKSGTTLTCEIYSDSERTTLLKSLSLTLHADHSFRYVFACNTNDDEFTVNKATNRIANLKLE